VAGGVLSIYAGDPIALAFQGDAARPICEAVTDDTGRFDIAWRNDFANYVVLRSQDVRFFISDIVIESPVDLGEINASSRQPPIVVEVVDADGVPLSGALIAIEVSGAAPSVSVETNAEGIARVPAPLSASPSSLGVSKLGYQSQDVPLIGWRSEEHTSELQSRENLVCRLLLEKKKTKRRLMTTTYQS